MTLAIGIFCLVAVAVPAARALDPGDGTVIGVQQVHRTEQLDLGNRDPVRLDLRKGGAGGGKAELAVYQVYAMHFGTLVDNDGYVVLGTADSILQDPDHLVYGGVPQSAEIRLNGDPFVSVAVDITGGSASGFSLDDFDTDYGKPPLSGLTLDASGLLSLHVGARLQLYAGGLSPGGGQQIGYTISAVYE